jgi:ribosomal protein L11 methylase PrmA
MAGFAEDLRLFLHTSQRPQVPAKIRRDPALRTARPGRLLIAVNPGMAFGTGAHESTQLYLEALERELQPGMMLLDVGTGSGILSRAAALLGAKRVIACDIDPVAVVHSTKAAPEVPICSQRLFTTSRMLR